MTEENTQTEVVDIVETIQTEVKPDISPKPMKIRDYEDTIRELRKDAEKARKSRDEIISSRAKELAAKEAEALKADIETKAMDAAKAFIVESQSKQEAATKAKIVKTELRAQAEKAGVAQFSDLYEIMKATGKLESVEFDSDGDVTNAADIISELKQSKPHFFHGVSTSSNAKAPADRMTTPMNVKDMPDAEFKVLLRNMGVHVP